MFNRNFRKSMLACVLFLSYNTPVFSSTENVFVNKQSLEVLPVEDLVERYDNKLIADKEKNLDKIFEKCMSEYHAIKATAFSSQKDSHEMSIEKL